MKKLECNYVFEIENPLSKNHGHNSEIEIVWNKDNNIFVYDPENSKDVTIFTSIELKEIAKKLDELNKELRNETEEKENLEKEDLP